MRALDHNDAARIEAAIDEHAAFAPLHHANRRPPRLAVDKCPDVGAVGAPQHGRFGHDGITLTLDISGNAEAHTGTQEIVRVIDTGTRDERAVARVDAAANVHDLTLERGHRLAPGFETNRLANAKFTDIGFGHLEIDKQRTAIIERRYHGFRTDPVTGIDFTDTNVPIEHGLDGAIGKLDLRLLQFEPRCFNRALRGVERGRKYGAAVRRPQVALVKALCIFELDPGKIHGQLFLASIQLHEYIALPDELTRLEPDGNDLARRSRVELRRQHSLRRTDGFDARTRALEPDGLMIAATFGGRTLDELRRSLGEAEIALTGGLSPRVAPMGEIRDLGALLQRAGLALPVADALPLMCTYETAWHLMRDLRAMGEASALAARPRGFTRRSVLLRACALYAETHADTAGRIPAIWRA